ncbi:hypothetical protein E5Z46_18750 [Geobacillus kaustophilus NBRC 102445]|nr:hypothetical protein E5Z46_18750 [Geobacillus kaustophilus NBRC 102445]QHB48458.1 hypothetical protein GBK1_52 [Geobacillus phage GBK1]
MVDKLIEYLEARKMTITKLLVDAKSDRDRELCECAIRMLDSIIRDAREGKIINPHEELIPDRQGRELI